MAMLEKIHSPEDIKGFDGEELESLCEEMRRVIIDTVSANGGHLASNLGVVELTVALGLAFSPPRDTIVWDVGHQSYPYKLLTGRYGQFHTIRTEGGLAGFPCREESPYDLFTCGHSSTSISSALGVSEANYLQGKDGYVVAVIGDGALTGGLAYEGLNNAGRMHRNLIVILNDNTMSISKNVGALSEYFKHLRASASWYGSKKRIRDKLTRVPLIGKPLARAIENAKNMVKSVTTGGEMFEALGFRYLGPFDGHNIEEMTHVFEEAKQVQDTPLLIHVITKKGYGYDLAERQPEKFHGVAPFRVENGMKRSQSSKESAAQAAGKELMNMAAEDARVVAVTAAMAGGTGLTEFASYYPSRFFDVGIAEQHAVSMAAGMARGGYRPYFAVYSTFLQRAYDQIVHDVCLQNLPVCILSDHVGLVGDDGKTHHGVLSVPMLMSIPNLTLLAPRDTRQIRQAVRATLKLDGPCVVQYPKEGIEPYAQNVTGEPFAVGKWQTLIPGGQDAVILAYGRMTQNAIQASELLVQRGLSVGVIDCCSLKPLDMDCLRALFERRAKIVTIEEGEMIGGFGSEIARVCVEENADAPVQIIGLENRFITHGSVPELLRECGLTPEQLADRIEEIAGDKESSHVG